MGYMDSKYYERLGDFIMSGDHSEEEIGVKSLEFLEEELAHPEIYSNWLVGHFNDTAQYMCDTIGGGEDIDQQRFDYMADCARKEIDLFRKYGHDGMARVMEKWLDEACEMHYEAYKLLAETCALHKL